MYIFGAGKSEYFYNNRDREAIEGDLTLANTWLFVFLVLRTFM